MKFLAKQLSENRSQWRSCDKNAKSCYEQALNRIDAGVDNRWNLNIIGIGIGSKFKMGGTCAMVRKHDERIVEKHEHKFGGDGYITVRSLTNCEKELNGKGRVFAHTTLLPGCSIGFHKHEGESETYYIFSGKGEFNDNGTTVPIEAGDVTFTPSGTGHGISNTGSEPMEIIALILYA